MPPAARTAMETPINTGWEQRMMATVDTMDETSKSHYLNAYPMSPPTPPSKTQSEGLVYIPALFESIQKQLESLCVCAMGAGTGTGTGGANTQAQQQQQQMWEDYSEYFMDMSMSRHSERVINHLLMRQMRRANKDMNAYCQSREAAAAAAGAAGSSGGVEECKYEEDEDDYYYEEEKGDEFSSHMVFGRNIPPPSSTSSTSRPDMDESMVRRRDFYHRPSSSTNAKSSSIPAHWFASTAFGVLEEDSEYFTMEESKQDCSFRRDASTSSAYFAAYTPPSCSTRSRTNTGGGNSTATTTATNTCTPRVTNRSQDNQDQDHLLPYLQYNSPDWKEQKRRKLIHLQPRVNHILEHPRGGDSTPPSAVGLLVPSSLYSAFEPYQRFEDAIAIDEDEAETDPTSSPNVKKQSVQSGAFYFTNVPCYQTTPAPRRLGVAPSLSPPPISPSDTYTTVSLGHSMDSLLDMDEDSDDGSDDESENGEDENREDTSVCFRNKMDDDEDLILVERYGSPPRQVVECFRRTHEEVGDNERSRDENEDLSTLDFVFSTPRNQFIASPKSPPPAPYLKRMLPQHYIHGDNDEDDSLFTSLAHQQERQDDYYYGNHRIPHPYRFHHSPWSTCQGQFEYPPSSTITTSLTPTSKVWIHVDMERNPPPMMPELR